ncbi:unnamed protein product, partial [Fusarium fujikuroi]
MASIVWDPADVLQISDHRRCIGITTRETWYLLNSPRDKLFINWQIYASVAHIIQSKCQN